MSEQNNFTERLFRSYLNGTISGEERKLLFRMITDRKNEDELLVLLMEALEKGEAGDHPLPSGPDELFRKIMEEARQRKGERSEIRLSEARSRRWWLVAASLLLPLALSVYLLWQNFRPDGDRVISQESFTRIDVPPGGNRAILTLNNGEQVVLDTLATGTFKRQDGVEVVKQSNGLLEYLPEGTKSENIVYHTITTPVGGQYQLILTDGTRVWINAASSVRYPAAFSGDNRKVSVTGEVYFEVSHQTAPPRKGKPGKYVPFEVDIAGKGKVVVLGTRFNINAYSGSDYITTTLVEGSILYAPMLKNSSPALEKAYPNSGQIKLLPGQQVVMDEQGQTEVVNDVDIERVLAWKNGYFSFASSSLQEVMDQMARWYGIDVNLEDKIRNERFSGKIQLDLNLSEVVKILEKNDLSFRMDGNTLYVRSL